MTGWDSPSSDPITDIRNAIERELNRPYKLPHNCEVDGHLIHLGSLLCPMCGKKVRDKLTEYRGDRMSDWVYEATVVNVYDGDTITVDLDMGMRVWQHKVSIRLAGIDAPEMTGPEKPQGIISRDHLRGVLPVGAKIGVVSHSFEKYGRLLATVWDGDMNVNQHMVSMGYAVAS